MAITFPAFTRALIDPGTDLVLTKPSGLVNGDYLQAKIGRDDNVGVLTLPTDWVTIARVQEAAGDDRELLFAIKKIVDAAGEPDDYTFVWDDSEPAVGTLAIVRGANLTDYLDVAFVEGTHYASHLNTDAPNPPSITTVTDGAVIDVLVVGTNANGTSDPGINNATFPTGYTAFGGQATGWDRAGTGGRRPQWLGCFKEIATAGADNPSAFGGLANALNDFSSMVIAIKPAASGTLFEQTVGGSLSFVGLAIKEAQKLLVGGLTFSAALATSLRFARSLTGAVSFTGVISKETAKFLVGTLTLSGATTKETQRALTGLLSLNGAMVKETGKVLVGSLTTAGDLASISVFTLSTTGALTFVGVLSRGFFITADATLTFTGAIAKEIQKNLTGALTFQGAISKLIAKQLSGELSFAGGLVMGFFTSKLVIGVLEFIGGLSTLFVPAPPPATLRRMWRSLWSRIWKDPGTKDEDT